MAIDAEQVRERVLAWFSRFQSKVALDSPGRLEISSGSQAKMRILGGAFIAASSLPTRTVVTTAPNDGGIQVTVEARDSIGLGLKTGMKGKYQTWTAEIVEGLREALA